MSETYCQNEWDFANTSVKWASQASEKISETVLYLLVGSFCTVNACLLLVRTFGGGSNMCQSSKIANLTVKILESVLSACTFKFGEILVLFLCFSTMQNTRSSTAFECGTSERYSSLGNFT